MATNDDAAEAAPAPKKSKLGLIITIVVGVVVLVGGVAAGAMLGPKLLGGPAPAEAEATAAPAEPAVPEKVVTATFDPIVIDIGGRNSIRHHLKVGLSAELRDGITEDDFRLVAPRGREAALTYLRTLDFETVTDPKKYQSIRKSLSKRIKKAVGEDKVHRILLVDFVAQ